MYLLEFLAFLKKTKLNVPVIFVLQNVTWIEMENLFFCHSVVFLLRGVSCLQLFKDAGKYGYKSSFHGSCEPPHFNCRSSYRVRSYVHL